MHLSVFPLLLSNIRVLKGKPLPLQAACLAHRAQLQAGRREGASQLFLPQLLLTQFAFPVKWAGVVWLRERWVRDTLLF